MKDFKNNIDKMVSKILSEEIEKKSKQVFEQIDEELKGNQKKLDVAEPKGKLTAADFKKLTNAFAILIFSHKKRALGQRS